MSCNSADFPCKSYRFSFPFICIFSLLFSKLSFADVFFKTDENIERLIAQGSQFLDQRKYHEAWEFYRNILNENYEKIDHLLMKTAPGEYRDVKTVLLEKIMEVSNQAGIFSVAEKQAEIFFNKKFLDGKLSPKEDTEKEAFFHLPAKNGFKIFNFVGDQYAERGNCLDAVLFWEKAKGHSAGYRDLSDDARGRFFAKLDYCYSQLKWRDNEGSDVFEAVIPEGAGLLCRPVMISGRIFAVSADDYKNLYLLTWDKKSRKILRKQFVAFKALEWILSFNGILPYRLLFETGKIKLVTEASYHEFTADGRHIKAIDFNIGENRRLLAEYYDRAFSHIIPEILETIKTEGAILGHQKKALEILGELRRPEFVPFLVDNISLLQKWAMSRAVASILKEIAPREAAFRLIEKLKDKKSKRYVAKVLGFLGEEAVPFLKGAFYASSDYDFRKMILSALKETGSEQALPPLREALDAQQ